MQFEDGVAVVSGAGSGLGAALARRFASAGMRVAVADLDFENANAVAEEIRNAGGRARAFEVDLGDEASIGALARSVEEAFGATQILASNVGVQQFGTVEDLTTKDWEWVYRVNVFGGAAMVRHFLPQLRRSSRDARIVFTASTSSLYPASHMAAYVSSKYALLGLVESLRIELAAEGIGVSAILPGPMSTNHLASSQEAKPDAEASLPVFTPETIQVVAAAAAGELIDPDTATRNLLDDLAANRPYTITHYVHHEPVRERIDAIEEAFELAKRAR